MFLKNIKWDITKKCFLSCSFCLNKEIRENEKYDDISTDNILNIIDKLNSINVRHIQFLGGEPLYRKDFFTILNYINEKTNIKAGINTNGVILNTEYSENILKLNCIDGIYVSIDGLKDTHNRLRGAVIYDKIIKNISYFIQNRNNLKKDIKIYINTVLTKENISEIKNFIMYIDSIGIDEWIGLQLITNNRESEFNHEETLNLLKILGEINKKTRCSISPKFASPLLVDFINKKCDFSLNIPMRSCGAGLTFAYIDWEGLIYPCDRTVKNTVTQQFFEYENIDTIKCYDIDIHNVVQTPLFQKFNFIYDHKPHTYFNECEKLFNDEKERIKSDIKKIYNDVKKIKLSNNIQFNQDKVLIILFDHNSNEIYEVDDISYISLLNILKVQQESIPIQQLILLWIDDVEKYKYFINVDTNDIITSFTNTLNDLIIKDIIYAE